MEGLRQRRTYVWIKEGMMTRRAIVGDDPKLIQVVTRNNGDHVDQLFFDKMQGKAESIYITTRKIKDQGVDHLCVDMALNGENRTLQMALSSRPATGILSRWENINHNTVFTIYSGYDEKGNFIWIEQHGETIPSKYTKDSPHDQPAWEKVVKDGVEQTDKTKALRFWKAKILQFDAELRDLRPPAHAQEFLNSGPTSSDQWQ